MEKTCERCGEENPAMARFCRHCGVALTDPTVRSATPAVPVMKQWRMLSQTMTRKEVRRLLGEPMRIETNDRAGSPASETWTYEYETAEGGKECVGGSITFSASMGNPVSWIEPDWKKLAPRPAEAPNSE